MKPLPARIQLLILLPLLLAAIWGASYYEISRSQREQLHDAETATVFQAQAYAENTLASIKRLNELLLDLRSHWNGRPEHFSETIRARQEHIGDITFQVAIIDRDGYLAYSNLTQERVYLGASISGYTRTAAKTACSSANPCWARYPANGPSSSPARSWSMENLPASSSPRSARTPSPLSIAS